MLAANDMTLTNDPAWPWSLPTLGLPALAVVALVLVGLTVWTYLGVPGATVRRVLVVLGLRLAALVLACLALLRPSLAYRDELRVPSFLLIAADNSESMTIQDEFDSQARWHHLLRTLQRCEPQLQRLRDERNVTVVLYRFAGDIGDFDPQGKADGKRTDFGEMLHALHEKYHGERFLRGLLVLSDGADNGSRYPALPLAAQWRGLPCPVHTFAFGKPTTNEKQNDIALVAINPEPSPVPVKGELTVKVTVDAPGFAGNTDVDFHIFIEDKEVPISQVLINDQKVPPEQKPRLPLTTGNDVRLKCTAPSEAGEVRLTVKIDPKPGEVTAANNEISTYLTVAKEGLSVLLVDKFRVFEPQYICDALRSDPSIRLHVAWLRKNDTLPPDQTDLFQFGKQHYDVIILGDVSAKQVSGGNPDILRIINQLVFDKGTGLLMMGGTTSSFGNSDWQGTPIADLLPVELDKSGQIDGLIKMTPTEVGRRRYLMTLADNKDASDRIWESLPELNGMTRVGAPKKLATVYAQSGNGDPILVGLENYGKGRTLAFAGDTTWRWRTPELQMHHARFWKQIVLWLAHQENRKGNVIVKPETRRLAAGGKLGFLVDLKGKGDTEAKEKHFDVKVVNPQGVEEPVLTATDKAEERGTYWKTDVPGEYRLQVRGWGKDADGNELPAETATARFLVYQDDAEMARRAADHEFLRKLAATGGGQFHKADELARFLQELLAQPLPQGKPKAELWPDWRRSNLSGFLVGFFLLFVALLSMEWFLRRRWGLV